jgi:hypothetical protein
MYRRGDLVPHFDVVTRDGARATYSKIWQRLNLLLVALPAGEPGADDYASRLAARWPELTANDTACVITSDDVDRLPAPAVLIADRWGEVFFAATVARAAHLPDPEELVAWLRYVQNQCPECEGESR